MIAAYYFTYFLKALCTTFFLCALFPVQAQTQKNQGGTRSDETQFNIASLSSAVVDKSFRGISIKDVAAAIESNLKISKGEFESTSEFAARVDVIAKSIRIRGNALDKPIAIVVNMDSTFVPYESFKYKYNADNSELALYALARSISLSDFNLNGVKLNQQLNLSTSSNKDIFNISRQKNSESSYIGSNVFGVNIKVQRYEFTQFGLVTKPVAWLNYSREEDYIFNEPVAARVQLPNATATKALPSLSAILVFQPNLPFITYDFVSKRPTVESPTHKVTQGKYINGELLGVVFFNKQDGLVIHRIPEKFGLE